MLFVAVVVVSCFLLAFGLDETGLERKKKGIGRAKIFKQRITINFFLFFPIQVSDRRTMSIKSLIPHLDAGTDFAWQQFVKAPYFIPENKTIDDTLQEMRTNHNHLAIVVDEFGGTSGMITMEDILEEVFGDMQDEFDDEEKAFVEMGNGVWVFEAKVLLVDFIRETELPIDMFDHLELESDSLGGMVSERLGRMPKRGDEVQVGKVRFRVESADMRRVKKIKISIVKTDAGEE